jgi:hypothetical protein
MGLEGVTIDLVDAPVAAGLGGTLAVFGRVAAVAAASFEGGGTEDGLAAVLACVGGGTKLCFDRTLTALAP